MFFECEDSDVENYAYDTPPYTCAHDTDAVVSVNIY